MAKSLAQRLERSLAPSCIVFTQRESYLYPVDCVPRGDLRLTTWQPCTSVYPVPGDIFQTPTSFLWIATARMRGDSLPAMATEWAAAAAVLFALLTVVRIYAADRSWQVFIPGGSKLWLHHHVHFAWRVTFTNYVRLSKLQSQSQWAVCNFQYFILIPSTSAGKRRRLRHEFSLLSICT